VDLVDFAEASGPDQTHPRLLQYVNDRFRAAAGGASGSPAIYLQYHGHSRTIVGVERAAPPRGAPLTATAATRLLVLDPAWRDATVEAATATQRLRRHRVGLQQLRRRQYQLVVVAGTAQPSERAALKRLTSLRLADHEYHGRDE
jgi:hypothetical protein